MKSIKAMLLGGAADAPMDFAAEPVSRAVELRARIEWMWVNRTHAVGAAPATLTKWRYVPRAIDEGPDWRVYDRVLDRHLTDDELLAIPLAQLKTATHLN